MYNTWSCHFTNDLLITANWWHIRQLLSMNYDVIFSAQHLLYKLVLPTKKSPSYHNFIFPSFLPLNVWASLFSKEKRAGGRVNCLCADWTLEFKRRGEQSDLWYRKSCWSRLRSNIHKCDVETEDGAEPQSEAGDILRNLSYSHIYIFCHFE